MPDEFTPRREKEPRPSTVDDDLALSAVEFAVLAEVVFEIPFQFLG